jgi:hypothetical protein
MRRRRIILAAVLLALVAGIVVVLWRVNDGPPFHLILKHGFPPAGGPTGNTVRHPLVPWRDRADSGESGKFEVLFVELAPGYAYLDRSADCCRGGDLLGRLFRPLGIPIGSETVHTRKGCRRWAEFPRGLWISREPVEYAQVEHAVRDRHGIWFPFNLVDEFALKNLPGSFRLASQSEYDLATTFGAIVPHARELGVREDEMDGIPCVDVLPLQPPGSRREYGFTPREVRYRLVWIPPEDE